MTSLIDVIFLLLLFFMLSSTFSKYGEIEMRLAGSGSGAKAETPPLFVRLEETAISLNAAPITLTTFGKALLDQGVSATQPRVVLVSVQEGVSAQRLADILVVLNAVDGAEPAILGAS